MKMSRIYILPTRYGFIYIGGALTIILIGSAYHNNLVHMLAFFMLSLASVCAIQTFTNVKDTRVEAVETEGGFAGEEFIVQAIVANDAKQPRMNLEMRLRGLKAKTIYNGVHRIPPGGRFRIKSSYPAERRGRHGLKQIQISSVFPLGLFRAWTWCLVEAQYFIYPKLLGSAMVPMLGESGDQAGRMPAPQQAEDFSGHRRYQTGDSYHHVDWKAFARGRSKMTKEFFDGQTGSIELSWNYLEGLEAEARLSQLSQWVEESRKRGLRFSLRLPAKKLPPGKGLPHAILCWEALAAYEPNKSRSV
jgi:uncharacterized protein (DUF58 family)